MRGQILYNLIPCPDAGYKCHQCNSIGLTPFQISVLTSKFSSLFSFKRDPSNDVSETRATVRVPSWTLSQKALYSMSRLKPRLFLTFSKQTGWYSGNAFHMYSGGTNLNRFRVTDQLHCGPRDSPLQGNAGIVA